MIRNTDFVMQMQCCHSISSRVVQSNICFIWVFCSSFTCSSFSRSMVIDSSSFLCYSLCYSFSFNLNKYKHCCVISNNNGKTLIEWNSCRVKSSNWKWKLFLASPMNKNNVLTASMFMDSITQRSCRMTLETVEEKKCCYTALWWLKMFHVGPRPQTVTSQNVFSFSCESWNTCSDVTVRGVAKRDGGRNVLTHWKQQQQIFLWCFLSSDGEVPAAVSGFRFIDHSYQT